jgi:uncharacterized membrane protein YozB (DUF420 family)
MAAAWLGIAVLVVIVLVFASIRAATDLPHILSGRPPGSDTFEARYVAAPWLAYLHIIPGVLYLLGAPLQLHRGFRERHFEVHRVMGRIILPAGIISGVFALAFGIPFSFGGAFQSLAAGVFGSWFLLCLLLAAAAIRRRDVGMHRRWMIRAFAVGIGVGTIRLWIGMLAGLSDIPIADSFALAFWLGLSMNVVAGELWLARNEGRNEGTLT